MNYPDFWKRGLDLLLGGLMFLVFLPIFVFLMLFLTLYFRGNPFFFQERPGRNAKIFRIIKFKTMNDAKDAEGKLLSDELRTFKVGRFIRRTSFDELPQLINVLKGDMSLVGPRPLLVEYLPLYNEIQAKRHFVRPGVTGWAQINGRNAISWNEKFHLDVWYVEHLHFWLDIRILIRTLWNVLTGKGVSQQGHVTVGKFRGNN